MFLLPGLDMFDHLSRPHRVRPPSGPLTLIRPLNLKA
ncbi:hypothetical protein Krac_1904 [Ktedonobacter racemifer DSM 44963]|uniref:Uncharacterized protein n=1 Tax=Ktedonobacter racemifer DSM 44963 TaxID=485913 RepID=D6U3W5_KTERA|nr:hypothetical protein Krac_1904 [Ktedonobacter racemifer DSM 44963]